MKKLILFILISFLACTTEKIDPFLIDTNTNDDGDTNTEDLERLTPDELEYMTYILTVESEMDTFWNGYNSLREIPVFIITEEDQGIFINPPSSQMDSSRLLQNELTDFDPLNLYRNEILLDFVKQEIANTGCFYCVIEYDDFTLYAYDASLTISDSYFYDAYKNRNELFHVAVFFHELFHFYSLFQNADLFLSEDYLFDVYGYPLNEETLPLILMLFDVMSDAYHLDTVAQTTNYLKYYVSIQHQLNSIDDTENNLVRNHGFHLEKIEGSARYIEVFSTLYTIDNNTIDDPTHGFKEYSNSISNWSEVLTVYAFRMFYHTGGGAIHLLKELECPQLEQKFFIPENTPFDIAESFLNMNESERDSALDEVKDLYDWESLLIRSDYLLSLQ